MRFGLLFLCILLLAAIVFFVLWTSGQQDRPEDEGTVIAVVVFSRHGERTSITSKSGISASQGSNEDETGDGQLTVNGGRQMQRLGRLFRAKYSDLLQAKELQVTLKTPNNRRCMQSIEHFIRGAELHSTPEVLVNDSLLHFPKPDCPAAVALMNQTGNSSAYPDLLHSFRDFELLFLPNQTQEPEGDAMSRVFALQFFADDLLTLSGMNQQPAGVDDETVSRAREFMAAYVCSMSAGIQTQELYSQPLISDVLSFMRKATTEQPILAVYNTHDILMDFLLRSMGVYKEGVKQAFAATIVFELRQLDFGRRVVHVSFWDPEDDFRVTDITANNCPLTAACDWDDFVTGFDYLMNGTDCFSTVTSDPTTDLEKCYKHLEE